MNLGLQQSQKQTISLNLTQQMELSIKVLQMDNIELDEYIGNLALENPVVELEDPFAETPGALRQKKLEWLEQQARHDGQNRAYYDDGEGFRQNDIAAPAEMNLPDYLALQAGSVEDAALRRAVLRLIRHIDQNGYLRASEEELARCCAGPGVEKTVAAVQQMEPAGVGARSLSECLLLQLPPGAALERQIAADYLEPLAKRQFEQIAKALRVTKQQVVAARDAIRALDPCPGSAYEIGQPPVYVVPDLLVLETPGGFEVVPHRPGQCEMRYNQSALKLAKEVQDEETAQYLSKKLKQAEWVEKCIENRGQTVLRVAREILRRQQGFFVGGPARLTTLSLSDVARDLELHESTVSRAVRGKYLQCDQGVFPLRYFFTQGVKAAAEGEQDVSSESVRYKMKQLIDEEDKQKPYSDQKLAELLGGEGIDISRRTVAKYRAQLNIPPKSLRVGGE